MDPRTTVWLIRHGVPEGMEGRCYGRLDVALSAEGIRQATAIANYLAGEKLTRIYSSPMKRALETARAIAERHTLGVETLEALSEIAFGDFEGLRYDDIQTQYPDIFQS